jgi:hypothetical protein
MKTETPIERYRRAVKATSWFRSHPPREENAFISSDLAGDTATPQRDTRRTRTDNACARLGRG